MIALMVLAAAFLQQDDFQKWVLDLGNESIEVRENATRRLRDLGDPGIARLEKALEGAGPGEVRSRLAAILAGIRSDVEFAKVFGPTRRVTLKGKDLKLGDALKTLSEAGNFNVSTGKLDPEKRITIEAVDVTWWEALDRLAEAAGGKAQCKDTGIRLSPGLSRRLPRVYQDQFRISLGEIKRIDHVEPGLNSSVVMAVIEAAHQPNLNPSGQTFRDPIRVKSLKDSKGIDPRVERPDWVGGISIEAGSLSLHTDLWISPDAAFPLTLEGEVEVPFAKGSREVTVKFGADEPPTKIGDVTIRIKDLTQGKTGTRFELVATSDADDASVAHSMVEGSLVLIDSKGHKHPKRVDGWSASGDEVTWEFMFPDVAEPKQLVFRWVAEYHRIAIPFRLEGIQPPGK